MTTTRLERLTREALGHHTHASPRADEKASYAAPALIITAIASVLLLSGCALSPEQPYQTSAANLGEATLGVGQAHAIGNTLFTVP